MSLKGRVLGLFCGLALTSCAHLPHEYSKGRVMVMEKGPAEYLYSEIVSEYDGVEYLIYADPVKKECNTGFMYLDLNFRSEPNKEMIRFLEEKCEVELGFK